MVIFKAYMLQSLICRSTWKNIAIGIEPGVSWIGCLLAQPGGSCQTLEEADLDLCLNKIKSSFWGKLRFSWTQIASMFGVCWHTLYAIRVENGIISTGGFAHISDNALQHGESLGPKLWESFPGQTFTHLWKYWFWHLLHSHDFHLSVWKKQHMILDCKCKLVQSCSNTSARISLEHTTLFKASMNNAHSLLKMKHNVHP